MATIVHSKMTKLYSGNRVSVGDLGGPNTQLNATLDLTPSKLLLPSSVDGATVDFEGAKVRADVFVLGVEDTANWSISVANGPGIATSVVGNVISVTSLTPNSSYFDVTAIRTGYPVYTKRAEVAKINTLNQADLDAVETSLHEQILAEQLERAQALADEASARAADLLAEAAARTAAIQAEADARAAAILAEAAARGAAITNEATIRQSEDESLAQSITNLSASVAGDISAAISAEQSARADAIAAEAAERNLLATQMRGAYDGSDLDLVTSGLIFQEKVARSTAIDGLAQQLTLLSAGAGEQFDYKNIWYFDSSAEGWTGNGTPTVANGWLRPANHATDPYVISPVGIGANGSTYTQVRLRVRKVGTPVWGGLLWWRAAADSTWDVARQEALTEPTYDENGIGLVTVDLVWTGTIDRLRLDLSPAQTATDYFEIDWAAIGRPSPGASAAALLDEQTARAQADLSEATARQALSTKLTGAADPAALTLGTLSSGLLYDERQARSTADSTEVTARQALSAKLTGFNDPAGKTLTDLASGLIYDEKTARVTEDLALAHSISSLNARVGLAEADISEEQTARADADSALATSFTSLSAKLDANSMYSVRKQWEFATTVEGWATSGATASVSAGALIWTTTGANPYLQFTFATTDRYLGSTSTKIRARIRRSSGSQAWEGKAYYTTSAHGAADTHHKVIAAPADLSKWTIVEWDMSALTAGGTDYTANEIRAIRLDLVGTAGDTWQIDWISLGEKVVSPASLEIQNAEAAITAEAVARASQDGVLAEQIQTLSAMIDGSGGGILAEQTIRANNDNVLVQAINTAWGFTGATNAVTQSGNNLITNWTAAQANKWSQLEAEVFTAGGKTIRAALAEEASVRANADGSLGAQWVLKTDINGYISGFGFASTANNATPTSAFVINADRFVMTMPGYGNHTPFAIGNFGPAIFGEGGFSVPLNSLVNQAAQPTSFLETFESGNLSNWQNQSGTGEISVISAANSLTGGKVLRVGNNSGNDQAFLIHKQNIPFDPATLYRLKFRVRRLSGIGTVYLGVAGVAADGATFVNTAGVNSSSSQHYVAASNQNPGTGWTEYVGYIKGTAAVGQSGTNPAVTAPLKLHQNVKYIRPLVLVNYLNQPGVTEVDYCAIESMTDAVNWDNVSGTGKDTVVANATTALTNASEAKVAADAATLALTEYASDSVLTAVEKKQVKREWDGIVAEKAGINAQATALGVTTENTNYNNAYNTLNTYITPLLSDLTTPSNIVGSTFRSTFSSFYTARQALLNKISAVAATKADWGNVQSRPSDADILNAGSNLILNPDLRNSPAGDGAAAKGWTVNANSGSFYYRGVFQDSSIGPPFDTLQPMFYTNSTGADGQVSWVTSDYIPVGDDRNYTVSAWLRRYSGNPSAYLGVITYDAAYASLGYVYPAGLSSLNSTTLSASWEHRYGVFGPGHTAFPVGTKFVRVVWWGTYLSIGATLATRFCFNEGVVPSRSVVPLDSSLINKINPITPSNVTTYIANAAIGNAQIGGDIYSSTWDWNNGWLLQRNGNLYCANAYVRGNVEASSLKANTLMVNRANIVNAAVDTLQIEGNAVTIPVHSRPVPFNGRASEWTTIATAWINAGGSTVSVFASASVRTTSSESPQDIYLRVLAPSGTQIGANSVSVRDALYSTSSLITSSAEAGTYSLQIYKPGFSAFVWAGDISLFLIGTKR